MWADASKSIATFLISTHVILHKAPSHGLVSSYMYLNLQVLPSSQMLLDTMLEHDERAPGSKRR